MSKRKQKNLHAEFTKNFQRAKIIANTDVSLVVRGAWQVGITVAKGVVPITAVQARVGFCPRGAAEGGLIRPRQLNHH